MTDTNKKYSELVTDIGIKGRKADHVAQEYFSKYHGRESKPRCSHIGYTAKGEYLFEWVSGKCASRLYQIEHKGYNYTFTDELPEMWKG